MENFRSPDRVSTEPSSTIVTAKINCVLKPGRRGRMFDLRPAFHQVTDQLFFI